MELSKPARRCSLPDNLAAIGRLPLTFAVLGGIAHWEKPTNMLRTRLRFLMNEMKA